MNPEILQKARDWANNPAFDLGDRSPIQKLIDELPTSATELNDRFYRGLEFGTGGMRGVLGPGENRINKYTVRRASQALALSILKHFPANAKVVVSYDSRNGSREFAEETCGVMAAHGIHSYIFPELTPTPMLSFAIRHYGAQGGVMVTASHNPPKYNGYKVFWADGAQVVPPVDQEIVRCYESLTDWSQLRFLPFAEARKQGFVRDTEEAVNEAFYQVVERQVIIDRKLCQERGSELNVVYTPLHGTGLVPCEKMARRLGFTSFHVLESQAKPDGNFSTVAYPNPEDPAALKLAVEKMLADKADLVFGTDPDCDRLGVVVNHQQRPHYLTGNQIGALFLDYIFKTRKRLGTLPAKPLVVKSIVTSPLQDVIAARFGAKVQATLTGFKWMADLIRVWETKHPDEKFLFASEESFGYMPHAECRDKDGVSSVALMCEIALEAKLRGKTLVDKLDEIFAEYGFFHEHLVALDYEGAEGAAKIKRIMDSFRSPTVKELAGVALASVDDYAPGFEGLPKSNVLGLSFQNRDKIFLRPSGTEPKIKFYLMVAAKNRAEAEARTSTYETTLRTWCEKA